MSRQRQLVVLTVVLLATACGSQGIGAGRSRDGISEESAPTTTSNDLAAFTLKEGDLSMDWS